MIPSFKIGNRDKLYVSKKYLCNGHWLINREAPQTFNFRPLKRAADLKEGSYNFGIGGGWDSDHQPNYEQVIPKRDKYVKLLEAAQRVAFRDGEDKIMAYVFKPLDGPDFEIGVAPHYVPLMRLGNCFAKDELSPVLILDGPTINDNLIGVVMPIRIKEPKK